MYKLKVSHVRFYFITFLKEDLWKDQHGQKINVEKSVFKMPVSLLLIVVTEEKCCWAESIVQEQSNLNLTLFTCIETWHHHGGKNCFKSLQDLHTFSLQKYTTPVLTAVWCTSDELAVDILLVYIMKWNCID